MLLSEIREELIKRGISSIGARCAGSRRSPRTLLIFLPAGAGKRWELEARLSAELERTGTRADEDGEATAETTTTGHREATLPAVETASADSTPTPAATAADVRCGCMQRVVGARRPGTRRCVRKGGRGRALLKGRGRAVRPRWRQCGSGGPAWHPLRYAPSTPRSCAREQAGRRCVTWEAAAAAAMCLAQTTSFRAQSSGTSAQALV